MSLERLNLTFIITCMKWYTLSVSRRGLHTKSCLIQGEVIVEYINVSIFHSRYVSYNNIDIILILPTAKYV